MKWSSKVMMSLVFTVGWQVCADSVVGYGQYASIMPRLGQVTIRTLDGPPGAKVTGVPNKTKKLNLLKDGITKEESTAWYNLLKELTVYIEKNEASASEKNKVFFRTVITKLYSLSDQFLNTVKFVHNAMLSKQANIDLGGIMAQVDRLKQPRAELVKLRDQLKPGWTDYVKTKINMRDKSVEIKKALDSFALSLLHLYDRALADAQKLQQDELQRLRQQREERKKQEQQKTKQAAA